MLSEDAVHANHCCKKHGCKYGDPDCPVEQGRIAQRFECESGNCFEEEIDIETLYREWCKETKRGGAVLIGGSIKEFFTYLKTKNLKLSKC